MQQQDLKLLFNEICQANPDVAWAGNMVYQRELQRRQENQRIVTCAQWLRQHHFSGPIKNPDLDARAVIAIALLFATTGEQRIVARIGQREIGNIIQDIRKSTPDIQANWFA